MKYTDKQLKEFGDTQFTLHLVAKHFKQVNKDIESALEWLKGAGNSKFIESIKEEFAGIAAKVRAEHNRNQEQLNDAWVERNPDIAKTK